MPFRPFLPSSCAAAALPAVPGASFKKEEAKPPTYTFQRIFFFFLIEERLHNTNEQWVPFPASPRKGLFLDGGRKGIKARLFRNKCWDEETGLSHVAGEESQKVFPIIDPRFLFKPLQDLVFQWMNKEVLKLPRET